MQEAQSVLYLLRGYMELCIYPPRPIHRSKEGTPGNYTWQHATSASFAGTANPHDCGPTHGDTPEEPMVDGTGTEGQLPLSWSCSDESIMQRLQARDPSGRGLSDPLALRLLLQLLHWSPHSRPTPQQVLLHAFFQPNSSDIGLCHGDRNCQGWC